MVDNIAELIYIHFSFEKICVDKMSFIARVVNVSWWKLPAMDPGIVMMDQMSQTFAKYRQVGWLVRKM